MEARDGVSLASMPAAAVAHTRSSKNDTDDKIRKKTIELASARALARLELTPEKVHTRGSPTPLLAR
jgi:hypothetical protein